MVRRVWVLCWPNATLATAGVHQALRDVVEQTQVPIAVQLDWISAMGAALGPELRKLYISYCETLRGRGVVAAGYVVTNTPYAGAGWAAAWPRTWGHPVVHGPRRRLRPVGTAPSHRLLEKLRPAWRLTPAC